MAAGSPLLLDVDSCNERLELHLTQRGWLWQCAISRGWGAWTDERILEAASAEGKVVYTANYRDFVRLGHGWSRAGRRHPGIIVRLPQAASAESQMSTLERSFERFGTQIANQVIWAVS